MHSVSLILGLVSVMAAYRFTSSPLALPLAPILAIAVSETLRSLF